MVTTRIRTGAITKVHYDTKTLRLRGENPIVRTLRHQKGFREVRKWKPLPENYAELIGKLQIPPGMIEPGHAPEASAYQSFDLPVSIGAVETEGMSVIQRADLLIDQLKQIKATHEIHMPRAVPVIQMNLMKAIEARTEMQNTPENTMVINESLRQDKVKQRISILTDSLRKSTFQPERYNIKCAILGYSDGKIPYQQEYTLIWAGKIVDKAKTYADFAADRDKRLDRYLKEFGPGWLWYERGLMENPSYAPRLSRATELSRMVCQTGLGQYNIDQAYQKRSGWVMRMEQATPIPSIPLPGEVTAEWVSNAQGLIYCQQEGPRLRVQSLLDSGATYPSLHPHDLSLLGIDRKNYAAQTIEEIHTANGIVYMHCYEMHVSVLDADGRDLVNKDSAVWPYHGHYLGGLCPVLLSVGVESGPGPEGFVGSARLSGILPFLACYYSSVPTRNKLYLGEDRNDVLGCVKFTGQRRWDIGIPSTDPVGINVTVFGDPKIQFMHRHGQVIDRDRADMPHASDLIVNPGRPDEHIVESYPKGQCDQLREQRRLAEEAANAAKILEELQHALDQYGKQNGGKGDGQTGSQTGDQAVGQGGGQAGG